MAFNIFERWPWTSFQNLNLDWLMNSVKEAVTKADEALSSTTGFDARITTAETNSSEANTNASAALSTANTADGKATEALSTANNASDTANAASANATQASVDSATALSAANQALTYVAGVKGTSKLVVSGNTITYNEVVQTGADIHNLFTSGNYPFCVYDDGNGTTYIYKPDVYAVVANIYTQSFTCITPASAAGADYELLKRLVIINGVPQFATDVELASTDYVDSQSGGGGGLPAVTTADNGKFLRVVTGAWAADTVPSAETTSFGP